ncbi:hypothetical protein QWZ13_16230 [Reinekea marina]|uniref:hypothetical protein n=1 Tax=Reinekea marina TaxID=1310421 RepID=UPI0025B41E82|nr:hypothetical protein [Reinekea marina]MDN3650457.1 hypothetical protein [Reinekea marina]
MFQLPYFAPKLPVAFKTKKRLSEDGRFAKPAVAHWVYSFLSCKLLLLRRR